MKTNKGTKKGMTERKEFNAEEGKMMAVGA
jgi:hypothetical protein